MQRLRRWAPATLDRPRDPGAAAEGRRRSRRRSGVTSVHEMSMPHRARDCATSRSSSAHRARLPVDAVPIVATMDMPQRDRPRPRVRSAATCPSTARSARGRRPSTAPYADGAATRHRATTPTTSSRASSTRATPPGCRWGCTRSATARSTRSSRAWERVYQALDSRERRHFRARRHRDRALRDGRRAAQVERAAMLGLGGLGAADLRPLVGRPRRSVRVGARPGSRRRDEPVPHDDRAGDRGRRRIRRARSRRSTRCSRSRRSRRTTTRRSGCPGSRRSASTRSGARDSRTRRRRRARSSPACMPTSSPTTRIRSRRRDLDGAARRSSRSRSAARSSPPERRGGVACHSFSPLSA